MERENIPMLMEQNILVIGMMINKKASDKRYGQMELNMMVSM